MKKNEFSYNGEKIELNETEVEKVYMIYSIYAFARYIHAYAYATRRNVFYNGRLQLSSFSCYEAAEKMFRMIDSGDFTDIEYAAHDALASTPFLSVIEDVEIPVCMVDVDGKSIRVPYADMVRIGTQAVKYKLLTYTKAHISGFPVGNEGHKYVSRALELVRSGQYTDYDYALQDVCDDIGSKKSSIICNFEDGLSYDVNKDNTRELFPVHYQYEYAM